MEKTQLSPIFKTSASNKTELDAIKRMMLKKKKIKVGATDFVALLYNLVQASKNKDIGFEHCSNDLYHFILAMMPGGVELDEAFVEDMLVAAQQLKEKNLFSHPTNKPFDKFIQDVVGRENEYEPTTSTMSSRSKK